MINMKSTSVCNRHLSSDCLSVNNMNWPMFSSALLLVAITLIVSPASASMDSLARSINITECQTGNRVTPCSQIGMMVQLRKINIDMCNGEAPQKCYCTRPFGTTRTVGGNFTSMENFGDCMPSKCECPQDGGVILLTFRILNEFLCAIRETYGFDCEGGIFHSGRFKSRQEAEDCGYGIGFRCKESDDSMSVYTAFDGFNMTYSI